MIVDVYVLPFALACKALLFNATHAENQCGKWYFNVFKSMSETLIFQRFSLVFNACNIGIPCLDALKFNDLPNLSGQIRNTVGPGAWRVAPQAAVTQASQAPFYDMGKWPERPTSSTAEDL
jgi:hypothetical protein